MNVAWEGGLQLGWESVGSGAWAVSICLARSGGREWACARLASVTMTTVPGSPPPNRPTTRGPRGARALPVPPRRATLSQRMANWFDLSRMFGTVKDILLSGSSAIADHRQLGRQHSDRASAGRSSGSPPAATYEDYASRSDCLDEEVAFGSTLCGGCRRRFSSTFHVAQALAQPQLTVLPPAGRGKTRRTARRCRLRRGSLLILGGDQVYPSASRERYDERFVKPLRGGGLISRSRRLAMPCPTCSPSPQPRLVRRPGRVHERLCRAAPSACGARASDGVTSPPPATWLGCSLSISRYRAS